MVKKILTCACVVFVAIAALMLTGCGKDKKYTLVGSWEHEASLNTKYTYTFNEDKTGSYSYSSAEMKFTYEDNGDSFKILYDGNTLASTYEYRIEGDKLIVKDSFGNDVEYVRKK